jgi:hypothetical protein
MSKLKEYKEVLNNYYVLKRKYEKPRKGVKNPGVKYCINCGKKGGTTFSRQLGNTSGNNKSVSLIAKCNTDNPCDLDINIKLANYRLYGDLVKSIRAQIEEVKGDIIKIKLDLLFQLKDEDYVVKQFEKFKNKMQKLSSKLDNLEKTYNEKNNTFIIKKKEENTGDEYEEKINREKGINITNKEIETNLSKYGKIIEEYKKTKNKRFLIDAFEKYHAQIVDLFKKKRTIQYQESNIETIKEEGGENKYIQFTNTSIENRQVSLNGFQIVKNVYK